MRYVALRAEAIREALNEGQSHSRDLAVLASVPEDERDQLPMRQSVCNEVGVQLLGGIFLTVLAQRLALQSLKCASGVAAMAGALSLGEVGCTQQDAYPLFHNATLVCTPWEQH